MKRANEDMDIFATLSAVIGGSPSSCLSIYKAKTRIYLVCTQKIEAADEAYQGEGIEAASRCG
jgi:hypothetical protein